MGRYYASEVMRNPKLQQRAIDYSIKKASPILQKVGTEALNQLSTKVRRNIRYKTDRPDLDKIGGNIIGDIMYAKPEDIQKWAKNFIQCPEAL